MSSAADVLSRIGRAGLVVLVNVLVFAVLFTVIEVAYRVRVAGVGPTARELLTLGRPPRSDLDGSHWTIYDGVLGYRLNPAREGFNSRSVRGPEIAVPKPPGTFRIIYLGDSVAWAEPGFVGATRDALADRGGFEVINAGVPGYTSYQEVLFFERYLAPTSPDLVVWTYCLNDNHRFLHRFDGEGRMLFTDEARARLTLDPPWDALVRTSYVLTRLHRFLVFRLGAGHAESEFEWETRPDMSIAWKDAAWDEHERNVVDLLRLLEGTDARVVVVIFPFEPQLAHASTAGGDSQRLDYILKPQRTLGALLEAHGVTYLDLFPIFLGEHVQGTRLFSDGIHLNAEGHALTARQILRFLDDEDLIPQTAGARSAVATPTR